MPTEPVIDLVTGDLRLDRYADPVLVDPEPSLLAAATAAIATAAPTEATTHSSGGVDACADADPFELSVLAREPVLEAVTDGFRGAGRVAAVVEAGRLTLHTLESPQPNAALLGRESGAVIVSTPEGRHAVETNGGLRERYEPLRAEARPFRIRTPSSNRIREAFAARCDEGVADAVVALLEAGPDPGTDVVGPRIRAYLAGARHGVDDYVLRRACEEAGLGSPSTFSGVKRRLVDAGLVTTERVPTPVGRPRKRLRLGEPLVDVSVEDTLVVARERLGSGDASGRRDDADHPEN